MRATMPRIILFAFLVAAVLLPNFGNAQVFQTGTPAPPATAEYAEWQFSNEPMVFNGLIYYPTRQTRFFDSQTMMQTGVYRSVPVYADVTLQPHSVVFVPVGRGLMRAYEVNAVRDIGAFPQMRSPERPAGTAGAAVPAPAPMTSSSSDDLTNIPRPTRMESLRRPESNDGVWLEYDGSRYYSRGKAVAFDPARFKQIGDYRGFAVFRTNGGSTDEIWVSIVKDGPVAPYKRERM